MSLNPIQASQQAWEQTREAINSGARTILIDSPPGAGKSTLVREISRELCLHQQVPIVVQTNDQADDMIRQEHLPPEIRGEQQPQMLSGLYVLPPSGIVLEELEADLIRQALEMTHNNQSRAAGLLGLSRYALRYRMQKHGLLDSGHETPVRAVASK